MIAAAALLPLAVCSAADPLFRLGLMTDTHWGENAESFARTEAVLQVFKRERVDIVCHIGDIADLHYPWAYRYYRQQLFPAVFHEKPPKELFVYANHDVMIRSKQGSAIRKNVDVHYAAMRKELAIPNAPDDRIVFRGYPILVFNQFIAGEKAAAMLDAAAKEFPDKPIILLDHVPSPKFESPNWRWSLYRKYPQLVHIYGHVHVPLRDETSIWQDRHTEINAGCLQNWRGSLYGTSPGSKDCFEFAIMDVYKDKLVFRRYSTEDGKEFKEPWVVPLPFDPATSPYRFDTRAKDTPAPEFPAGVELKLKVIKPFRSLIVTIPAAGEGGEVYKYYIRIARKEADGTYRDIARQDCYSEFYLAENKRTGKLVRKLSAAFFDPEVEYRVTVTPIGFFGAAGKPLSGEFTSPRNRVKPKLVFESRDPMRELLFAEGKSGDRPVPVKNGFYDFSCPDARLVIPEKYWRGEKGKLFRLTIDLDSVQMGEPTWNMVLRNAVPKRYGSNRLRTLGGKVENMRYVIELRKRDEKFFYDLFLQEGSPGLLSFNYVKLERFDGAAVISPAP